MSSSSQAEIATRGPSSPTLGDLAGGGLIVVRPHWVGQPTAGCVLFPARAPRIRTQVSMTVASTSVRSKRTDGRPCWIAAPTSRRSSRKRPRLACRSTSTSFGVVLKVAARSAVRTSSHARVASSKSSRRTSSANAAVSTASAIVYRALGGAFRTCPLSAQLDLRGRLMSASSQTSVAVRNGISSAASPILSADPSTDELLADESDDTTRER
jgi:hypothetical protein